jgi:hypothetical protein
MLLAIIFFLTTGLVFLWKARFEKSEVKTPPAPVAVEPVKPEPTPEPVPEPVAPTTTVSLTRPTPDGAMCDGTNSICVSKAYQDSALESPFSVTGTAVAFEQQFAWKLMDANEKTIASGPANTHAPDAGIPGPFEIRQFIFSAPATATGTLVLFESSAKDGEPIHILNISVKLPTRTMAIKLFGPDKDDLNRADCTKVVAYPVTIVKTSLPIEASLRALFSPSVPGAGRDLVSSISLVSVTVSNGVANVVIELQPGAGGSCLVQTQRAMIENTVKQFSSVKSVVISEKGKTPAESLQP